MKKILLITAIAASFATTSVNADTTAVLKVTGQLVNWLLVVVPQNSAAAAWLITVLSASPHFPQPM